jgi:hypothetical protein
MMRRDNRAISHVGNPQAAAAPQELRPIARRSSVIELSNCRRSVHECTGSIYRQQKPEQMQKLNTLKSARIQKLTNTVAHSYRNAPFCHRPGNKIDSYHGLRTTGHL